MKVQERAFHDSDLIPGLHLDLGDRLFGFHAPHDPVHLFLAQRRWFVADAHEASDAWGVAHHIPGFFVQDHQDEHVAGIDAPLNDATLTVAQLDLFFGRHNNFVDATGHPHRLDAVFQVFLDFVFITRVAMNNIPLGLGLISRGSSWLVDRGILDRLAYPRWTIVNDE